MIVLNFLRTAFLVPADPLYLIRDTRLFLYVDILYFVLLLNLTIRLIIGVSRQTKIPIAVFHEWLFWFFSFLFCAAYIALNFVSPYALPKFLGPTL